MGAFIYLLCLQNMQCYLLFCTGKLKKSVEFTRFLRLFQNSIGQLSVILHT